MALLKQKTNDNPLSPCDGGGYRITEDGQYRLTEDDSDVRETE